MADRKSDRKFVLSTVGISVLLNVLDSSEEAWRKQLNQKANERQLADELAHKVDDLVERAKARLREGNVQVNRLLSAELNGLYGIYQGNLSAGKSDMHYLVATDTALGRKAADVIRAFLRETGLKVDVYVPEGLSTADPSTFSKGMKKLIRWCEDTIPGYRDVGYRVVFNLTASFKSLQGYLNIMGMFYADEMVYIFETGSQLLSIPRLPLQIDINALRESRMELAMMAQGHIFPFEQVASIPDGLLEIDNQGRATLSDWGELIWNRVKQDLLGEDLLPFPRLQYTDTFRRDFKRADRKERAELQEILAKVAGILEDNHGDTSALKRDGGLQYDVYTNKRTNDGRPIGHFRVSQSRRVSCTAENGELRLRRYGGHSINDSP
jgi:putative CRISPR-associated protein (TIGR02619 family)